MLNLLKTFMTDYNYRVFKEDYDNLIKYKSNEKLWNKSMRKRYKNPPYFKENYEAVKFDYITYKDVILSNSDIDYTIYSSIDNDIKECLKLFYTTDTYIGYVAEELLYYKLNEAINNLYRSDYLDNVKKTDLVINGKQIQLKNISFLDSKYSIDNLREYQKRNRNLYFMFYEPTEENIYFTTVNNVPYMFNTELMDTLGFCRTKRIPLEDFIQLLL